MLTTNALLNGRLLNQQITKHHFNDAGHLLRWMGAMQAQDYAASKWAFGVRLPATSDSDIEQAIADRKIVRTWALRGTLHFVSPDDIHWILDLIRPRLEFIYASYYRRLELTEKVISKCESIIGNILKDDNELTRDEIAKALQAKKIRTDEMRINFILLRAALDGLVCFGQRRGKQFTFVLLDKWIQRGKAFNGIDAVAELARRYFQSHGPATVHDFAWWSGLTLTEIKQGIGKLGDTLKRESFAGKEYFMIAALSAESSKSRIFLLPAFDEYLVGYKERSHMLAETNTRQVIGLNGLFSPLILLNGKIIGTWKRKATRQGIVIEKTLFVPVSKVNEKNIQKETNAIANFYQCGQVLT